MKSGLKLYMDVKKLAKGSLHSIPADFKKALITSEIVQAAWKKITPLAQNEWICWITSVKKPETRSAHIERACNDLATGKRRPCCWPGCPHRDKKA